jgi:Uma2 family endonuclease
MMINVKTHKSYTYADYLKFTFDDMVEIIRGKIYKMSPAPSTTHQRISASLHHTIYSYFQGKSCELFSAPFDVVLPIKGKKIEASDRVVQPDLCVICDPLKITEQGCHGAPDWIIEILSPHTAKKDLNDKYDLYEESFVLEYWIVDPVHRSIEVFSLQDGKYQRISTYVADGEISPQIFPDLKIDLSKVFSKKGG